jgi:hypothetical protein
MLIAVAFGITKDGREIIEKIGKNVFAKDIEILDAKVTDIDSITYTDSVLAFGFRAKNLLIKKKIEHLELPDLKQLQDGNKEVRQRTYEDLLKFKHKINKQLILKSNDLSQFGCEELKALEQSLKDKKETSWRGITSNKKSFELSLIPIESTADIFMTFAELYAIKTAMDVLRVEEIIIEK